MTMEDGTIPKTTILVVLSSRLFRQLLAIGEAAVTVNGVCLCVTPAIYSNNIIF